MEQTVNLSKDRIPVDGGVNVKEKEESIVILLT